MKKNWHFLVIGLLFLAVCVLTATLLTQQQDPIVHSTEVTLTVHAAPDFTLTTSASHIDTFPNRTVGFAATVESVNNFAGVVVFAVQGLPPEMTVRMLPSDTVTLGPDEPKGISIEIDIPPGATLGDYTITVTATSTQYN